MNPFHTKRATEPSLGPWRRLRALGWVLALAFLGLGARLVDLQVLNHEKYEAIAREKNRRVFLKEPRRGDILDTQGRALAISRPVHRVCANPYFIGPFGRLVADAIAPFLQREPAVLAAQLQPSGVTNRASGKVVPKQFVDLKQRLQEPEWIQLTQALHQLQFPRSDRPWTRKQRRFYAALRTKGIYAEEEHERIYPNGSLAAHIIGFVRMDSDHFNSISVSEIRGLAGLEGWFQKQLAGIRGWRITEIDRAENELVAYRQQDVQPRAGLNVVTTIDLGVQNIVEAELSDAMREFSPVSASAVVVRPSTGEILAMATLPSYDPNQPGKVPLEHLKNRVVADQMEPGSTFKIVTVSAALNEGLVQLSDPIDCENGSWYYLNRRLGDAHPHGVLSVEEVLAKSSNIGSAKLALKLGAHKLEDYIRNFGFGAKTGIPLEGEIAGTIYPARSWHPLDITRIPMGHSVAVTHLQMVMALSAIANDGWLMRPMLVRQLVDASGQVFFDYPPQKIRRVLRSQAARDTTTALKSVVSAQGTGAKATLDFYTVAGKTGTAWIPKDGDYLRDKNIHSFIGFFPADRPEICLSVVLDQPRGRYASSTAAPTFRKIAELTARHLGIRPDREVLPLSQNQPSPADTSLQTAQNPLPSPRNLE